MIFVSTDILNPYARKIVSQESYPTLIDFLQDVYPTGFERPTDISINAKVIPLDDYDAVLYDDDVIVLLDRAALPVGLIGGALVTMLANLAISVALSYVANKLFAPDAPSTDTSPSSVYNVTSGQNMARYGDPVPIIYGRVRAYPATIVQPYYRYEDNIEYLYHVLCVGQGTMTTDTVTIGDDEDTSEEDLQWKMLYQNSFYDIPYNAYGVHITKTLSNPTNLEIEVGDGESERYTISADAEFVEYDYAYPNGLIYYESDGETTAIRTSYTVRIYNSIGVIVHTEEFYKNVSNVQGLYFTERIDISAYNEEVSISFEKTLNAASSWYVTNTFITRVKAIYPNKDFTQLYGNITLLACKIKASNAVSSRGQVEVNGYFTRTDVDNTMEAVLTDIYTNTTYGAGLKESDLIFPATGTRICCAYDHNITIWDAMRKPAIAQGWSLFLAGQELILKKDTTNDVTTALYNEMNIIRDSIKVNYLFKEEYPSYDSYETTYLDDEWTPRTEKYPTNGSRPQRVDLFGVAGTCTYDPELVFDATVTSITEPQFYNDADPLYIDDNGDGTWHVYAYDYITYWVANYNVPEVLDITAVDIHLSKTLNTGAGMFRGCENILVIDILELDTSNMTSMAYMFYQCREVSTFLTDNFNTSKVTDMQSMYRDTRADPNIAHFDTANVRNFQSMFYEATGAIELNLSNWTFYNADMSFMFSSCLNLICLSNINTLTATTTGNMFDTTISLQQPDSADQLLIASPTGLNWVHPTTCGGS